MNERLGILGGTFDPIHCGHLDVGRAAQEALQLSRVLVMTSNVPPHRSQPEASAFHRFAMAALAVATYDGWQVSDRELRRDGPSYTSVTLREFHALGYGAVDLFFILGADAFAELPSWKDYPAIVDQANFAVVSRTGAEFATIPPDLRTRMIASPAQAAGQREPLIYWIAAQTADVSATTIRRRRAAGQSIAGLVLPSVQQHIERHGLYLSNVGEASVTKDTPEGAAGRLHG
jgi:nicotinate-nucleotide adenylyltransferase